MEWKAFYLEWKAFYVEWKAFYLKWKAFYLEWKAFYVEWKAFYLECILWNAFLTFRSRWFQMWHLECFSYGLPKDMSSASVPPLSFKIECHLECIPSVECIPYDAISSVYSHSFKCWMPFGMHAKCHLELIEEAELSHELHMLSHELHMPNDIRNLWKKRSWGFGV